MAARPAVAVCLRQPSRSRHGAGTSRNLQSAAWLCRSRKRLGFLSFSPTTRLGLKPTRTSSLMPHLPPHAGRAREEEKTWKPRSVTFPVLQPPSSCTLSCQTCDPEAVYLSEVGTQSALLLSEGCCRPGTSYQTLVQGKQIIQRLGQNGTTEF